MPKGLVIDRSGDVPEIYIYDEIAPPMPEWWGESDVVSAKAVLAALEEVGDVEKLVVRINSPGGDVFEGVAIYNALVRHSATIHVEIDALAASIASLVAMAGDIIVMAGNALMMLHRAWTIAYGDADELSIVVESLRRVDKTIIDTYDARTGDNSTPEQIEEWLAAETWMTAEEAIERGFADRAGELKAGVEARVPEGRFKNTPKQLISAKPQPAPKPPDASDAPHGPGLHYLPVIAARIADARRRNAA